MSELDPRVSRYDFEASHAILRRYVDGNILAGVSSAVMVGRQAVDLHCIGWADKQEGTPMRLDHIFRVFSNTKLVTSCAALLLLEEGRFMLDDPIERFIPQLGKRRVLRPGATDEGDTEPADRSITIRHLLSHQSGLSHSLFYPETVLFRLYNKLKVQDPATSLSRLVDILSDLPLAFHPGTSWEYSVATDVIARLVEIISGQRFDLFIRSRIFEPLGMNDTTFVVPEEKRGRLASFYAGASRTDPCKPGLTRLDDAPYPGAYLRPVARLSGGGGLVSTLPDMVALVHSLLPGGPTLLKPGTIMQMRTNQLPDGVWVRIPGFGDQRGKGFGLAGAVLKEQSPLEPDSPVGEIQWGGIAGTHWWIDFESNVAGMVMTQRELAFWHPFFFEYKQAVYAALGGRSTG